MVDNQRIGRTFDTPEEATYWASGIKTKLKEAEAAPKNLSVSAAVDRYIESKDAVLSPSTIAGYKKIKNNLMTNIATVKLGDLTQEKVQRWVNSLAKKKSPKTVANAHGLLSAVLAEYRPSMTLRTTLPQKIKPNIQIPSEAEIKAILATAKGTKYELPIILAVWLGLRQSEILGLTWDCVDGNTIHIRQAIVMGENGPVEKGTKTYSGTRAIHLPDYIKELLDATPHQGDHIVRMSGKAIYSGFSRICEKAGVPHLRFHDLRHTNASVMLASGIPDKYSMKRMGHATNNMLKTTYQHTIKEKEAEYDQLIDSYFEDL
ncbi:MAG: tyrosine-type recombinase/integrase, partial [Anaerotignum sp.]